MSGCNGEREADFLVFRQNTHSKTAANLLYCHQFHCEEVESMNQTEKTTFPVYYRVFPASLSEKGMLEEVAARAGALAWLGVDGVVLAPDGQAWTAEEKTTLREALSAVGLTLREETVLSQSMEQLHHRCRRPNWEAVPYDPGEAKDLILQNQAEEAPALYFENENLPRSVSEMGDDGWYRRESASLLAAVLLTLRGTVVLYQGQELGMVNPSFPLEELVRSEAADWLATPDAQRRSQEELEAKIGRFTCLNARTVPDFDNPDARETVEWYHKLLTLRKTTKALQMGAFTPLLPEHRRALLYTRTWEDQQILVIANLSGYAAEYPSHLERGTLLLHNYQEQGNFPGILRPFEVKIYRFRSQKPLLKP